MRRITNIQVHADYTLSCCFDNGITRQINLQPILDKEAFFPLKNEKVFANLLNHCYFIEWPGLDINLSADTLWHWGKE